MFLTNVAWSGTATALAAAVPPRVRRAAVRAVGLPSAPFHARAAALLDPAGVRALALRAIDAAKAAGAEYTDVRLTRLVRQEFSIVGLASLPQSGARLVEALSGIDDESPTDIETLAVGVRVLVAGGWGFAASPIWTMEEMPRLAAEAVRQAKANAQATPRRVELARTPVVTGRWRTPGAVDPFALPLEEKLEALRAAVDYAASYPVPRQRGREDKVSAFGSLAFKREEWALATSEGTYVTQERFATNDMKIWTSSNYAELDGFGFNNLPIEYPANVGGGWEVFDAALVRRRIDAALDAYFAAVGQSPIPHRPVDVGRYDVVIGPQVAAQLVGQLFGAPCELDRAMGYEANAGGTSYLDDPLAMLGTLQLGPEALTVTADRSTPGGLATVKWDDEGVEPQAVTLVKNGVLTDLLTTRETATWLAPYYAKSGRPLRSGGTAAAESAQSFSLAHPPNLTLQPGPAADVDVDALVRDTKRGIAFLDGCTVNTDFQGRTGLCGDLLDVTGTSALVREIVNGRLGATLDGAAISFDAMKLWNTLVAVGGATSTAAVGATSTKGEPAGTTRFTVTAPALKFKDAAVIDYRRRA